MSNHDSAMPSKTAVNQAFPATSTGVALSRLADLPAPLQGTISSVCKHARLWKHERADVEAELTAHFHDGLAQGATPEKLLADFGDVKAVARLIRRGKLRNRPPWARAGRRAAQGLLLATGALVVLAGAQVIRFHMGEPTLRFSPVEVVNRPSVALPEDQRAWPIYRRAILAMDLTVDEHRQIGDVHLTAGSESMESWRPLVARAQPALALVREGAAKPALGYLAGFVTDHELNMHAWTVNGRQGAAPEPDPPRDPAENGNAVGILLPHLTHLRAFARCLRADAMLALHDKQPERAVANVHAIVSIARQLREPDLLICRMVSAAVMALACDMVRDILFVRPDALSDQDLRQIAHRLSALGGPTDIISFRGERLGFDDFLQRAYTDDGQGNGRFTPQGARLLAEYAALNTVDQSGVIVAALSSALLAGRKELYDIYNASLDLAERELVTPHWLLGPEVVSASVELEQRLDSPRGRVRYAPLKVLMPAISNAAQAGRRAAEARDATLVMIALEIHRRATGTYPASLDALVPSLLPAVPPDGADGKPLRYARRGESYILYSIGADLRDDAGTRPTDAEDSRALRRRPGTYTFNGPADLVFFPPS
jgi:hypothetical protein